MSMLRAACAAGFALMLAAGTAWAQPVPPGVDVERDVEFGRGGDVPLMLDIWRPAKPAESPRPVIVAIHGGGWAGGDKAEAAFAAVGFVQRGYVVASVNYRLSATALFPAAVEDCKCAVRWLRANAKRLGIDPDRIGAMGASAGGHLALMLGCADRTAGLEGKGGNDGVSSWVKAVSSWCGPADFVRGELEFAPNIRPLLVNFLGGPCAEKPEPYRHASPITHASWDDPPMLLVHGDQDSVVPFEQSERMHARLKELGVDVEFVRVRHGEHGMNPVGAPATEPPFAEVVERTLAFFDRHLE